MISDSDALNVFRGAYSMYANVELEARRVSKGWEIYIKDVAEPIGRVGDDGIPRLY